MIKFRFNYWSCSKFADSIRGVKKPLALSLDEWEDWREEAKKKHPFRYWASENLLNSLQNFIHFPHDSYSTIRIYIRNRFLDKTHFLKTGLKPGEWYDLDERILHGVFNELVNFVEIELAHLSKWNNEKKYKFKRGRCAQAGLDHLDWACSLKNEEPFVSKKDKDFGTLTPQAITSIKIKELYFWWKKRPERPDPFEVSGDLEDKTKDFKKINKIEQKYEKEDQKMLIELMKIRKGLWT